MSDQPVAVVTGAYRGLGLETCRQLGAKGYRIILSARRPEAGEAAVAELGKAGIEAVFRPLDVTDDASIQSLADFIANDYGRLDVLINNAGIFPDPPPQQEASSIFAVDRETLRKGFETNTVSALRLCQTLIPLMQGRRGRVVNVSSGMGQLAEMNGHCPAYRLSKTALNAVTRVFADELQGSGVKINSVCPGWVQTEMGGPNAERTVEQGASGIVWAATLPDDGPSGGFFRDGQAMAW